MGETTAIQWCDHTFNPWVGCSKVSAGCANCYAEALMDKRWGKVQWGDNGTRQRTSAGNWRQPLKWNRDATAIGFRRKVFCASLADVFEDRSELDAWRRDLWGLIEATPNLDWLLLTKRPSKILQSVPAWWYGDYPKNVWFGTSVEDQETADKRIPEFHWVEDAAIRFLSIEPLLGPIDLRGLPRVDWVIVGGESGKDARGCSIEWIRSIVQQCQAVNVPVFVKQLGSRPEMGASDYGIEVGALKTQDKKGGNPMEWPADLRIQQFPRVAHYA